MCVGTGADRPVCMLATRDAAPFGSSDCRGSGQNRVFPKNAQAEQKKDWPTLISSQTSNDFQLYYFVYTYVDVLSLFVATPHSGVPGRGGGRLQTRLYVSEVHRFADPLGPFLFKFNFIL